VALEAVSAGGSAPLLAWIRVEPARPGAPPPPAGLETRTSVGGNLLRWDASAGAVGYEVRREGVPVSAELVQSTHVVDRAAPLRVPVRYEVRAVGPDCTRSDPVETEPVEVADESSANVRVIALELDPADLRSLDADRGSDEEVPAVATIHGERFVVDVRNRGGSTRWLSKPGLRWTSTTTPSKDTSTGT
jgi:hypothetical protein